MAYPVMPLGFLGSQGGDEDTYKIERSLRFNSADSPSLSRTPTTSGSRRTFTFSAWIKRSKFGANQYIFAGDQSGAGDISFLRFESNDTITYYVNGSGQGLFTSAVFRDPSAWYHIILSVDTTQATDSNRVRLYVNGSQITSFSGTTTYYAQNTDVKINTSSFTASIGGYSTTISDGYYAEINFIDGQALTPSSFGETDSITGRWKAKAYSGTYGTNGFYLKFADNSGTTATTLGKDSSGNGNNWTPNNFSVKKYTNSVVFKTVGSTTWTAPSGVSSVNYLVVAGGGGSGSDNVNGTQGAGGGGGGVLSGTLSVTAGSSYSISVGAGGSGASVGGSGYAGGNSSFSSITAYGGGAGAGRNAGAGGSGGSGGGGVNGSSGGSGTSGQGNSGGTGSSGGLGGGGGGGGAGAAGGQYDGGNGISVTIGGYTDYYGGGGAGRYGSSPYYTGTGGLGGGGSWATEGADGYGGGGGGGGGAGGKRGGNGIVILSYSGAPDYYSPDNDSLLDSPTNSGTSGNYATMIGTISPVSNVFSYSNGNLDVSQAAVTPSSPATQQSTILIQNKTYFEVTITATPSAYDGALCGVFDPITLGANSTWSAAGSWVYLSDGARYVNGSYTSGWGSSFTNGDVIGCAVDPSSGKIWWSKNGVWQASGNPSDGTNPASSNLPATGVFAGYRVTSAGSYGSGTISYNFGQRPFSYSAPSGFKSLCTTNLPTPTIQKPSTAMDVVTYTGNGSTQTISGLGFSPDLVWIKNRSSAIQHCLEDTVRGAGATLASNLTNAEELYPTYFTAFNTDGFNLALGGSYFNFNGSTYVAWSWDAGSTSSTNNSGTITSTVSVNPTAGFSIVSYTGNGTTGSVGHGLGITPKMIIVKGRSGSGRQWVVGHAGLDSSSPWSYYLFLESTAARASVGNINTWGNNSSVVAPSSSVFTIGSGLNLNASSETYIAYCFSEIEGYSKFGSYTGNGSTDGVFIWMGFRPRWVMIKCSSNSASMWSLLDTERSQYNLADDVLYPNASNAEAVNNAYYFYDILSNGIKIRTSDVDTNGSGRTYIFAAFAESPFKYARAR